MTASGHFRRFGDVSAESALPLIATKMLTFRHVSNVPKTDMGSSTPDVGQVPKTEQREGERVGVLAYHSP